MLGTVSQFSSTVHKFSVQLAGPALHGKDTFVQMAAGAGKSLCMLTVPLMYLDTAV